MSNDYDYEDYNYAYDDYNEFNNFEEKISIGYGVIKNMNDDNISANKRVNENYLFNNFSQNINKIEANTKNKKDEEHRKEYLDTLTRNEFTCEDKTNSTKFKSVSKEEFNSEINRINRLNNMNLNEEEKLMNDIDLLTKPKFENYSEDRLKEEMRKYGLKISTSKNMIKQLNEVWNFLNMKILPENLKNNLQNFMNIESTEDKKVNYNGKGQKNDKDTLTDEKKSRIKNIITQDTDLWVKILNFVKIDFKYVKDLLGKKGIILENKILKDYLDQMGIFYSYE